MSLFSSSSGFYFLVRLWLAIRFFPSRVVSENKWRILGFLHWLLTMYREHKMVSLTEKKAWTHASVSRSAYVAYAFLTILQSLLDYPEMSYNRLTRKDRSNLVYNWCPWFFSIRQKSTAAVGSIQSVALKKGNSSTGKDFRQYTLFWREDNRRYTPTLIN